MFFFYFEPWLKDNIFVTWSRPSLQDPYRSRFEMPGNSESPGNLCLVQKDLPIEDLHA